MHDATALHTRAADHQHYKQLLQTCADSLAECLAGSTQAQNGPGSNRSRDALGKLFTPIVPLFTKQQNW